MAREAAAKDKNYDSRHTRERMQVEFTGKFGKPAYDWQLDTAEALLLSLDTVIIAGNMSRDGTEARSRTFTSW
ncbi:hypothetical protein K435DRAFT_880655 [Dendrothele bispora CBS 962.96]|uniref:Uncharacterized protein n=1 Tax=Dendrothele bispora (strain CBS 962.96) TaxID=1314807 RepID=A0A4S8KK81_DENBC|nr:hypothetical protein K435DRAFT_880655 [Dendrothele bispora CBS 962.96]